MRSAAGCGTGTGCELREGGRGMGVTDNSGAITGGHAPLLDHEKMEVYQVAREFYARAHGIVGRKLPRDLRDQFERAATSILFNIGEGAGKTARADKQRSYEIARGS